MPSLYHSLLSQHARQLTPVRCAEQTIAQLHRYFEDVVLENNLAALVVENLPLRVERPLRDLARVREVGRAARHTFLFVSPEDGLCKVPLRMNEFDREPVLLRRRVDGPCIEHFAVVADARFSALLASVRGREEDGYDAAQGAEVIWTFEPDIVYSALEYLMARVTAESPFQASEFSSAVRRCMPKATSLQLTVAVTTKLARLLQEQAAREIAVNRIANAIRSSLELSSILQTTVNEVGRALCAQHCALSVAGEHERPALTYCYFRDGEPEEAERDELLSDLHAYAVRLGGRHKLYVQDGCGVGQAAGANTRPVAVVPLIYHERFMGVLMVRSDNPARVWEQNEILLMRTVADQVAVAVNHARLFARVQQEALTDGLTGCFNRRSFEIQLERDLHLATRTRQPVSLIMLDIDNFKRVNDTHGHDAGDVVLRVLADTLREELRGIDTAARYGGEEFAVILPQAGVEGAMQAAERLRERIARTEVPGVGRVTASFGVATFPVHASSRDTMVTTADRALYEAKRSGRDRVCAPRDAEIDLTEELSRQSLDDDEPTPPAESDDPADQPQPAARADAAETAGADDSPAEDSFSEDSPADDSFADDSFSDDPSTDDPFADDPFSDEPVPADDVPSPIL